MPPARAIAIAIRDSVTVSIAELTSGTFSRIRRVSWLEVSAVAGTTSEAAGSNSTSSNVSPSMAILVGSSPPVGTGTAMGMSLSAIDMGYSLHRRAQRQISTISIGIGVGELGPTRVGRDTRASWATAGAIPVRLARVEPCETTCRLVCRRIRSPTTRATLRGRSTPSNPASRWTRRNALRSRPIWPTSLSTKPFWRTREFAASWCAVTNASRTTITTGTCCGPICLQLLVDGTVRPARACLRSRARCVRDLGLLPRLRRCFAQRGDVGTRRLSLRADPV